jgi:plastocyanin
MRRQSFCTACAIVVFAAAAAAAVAAAQSKPANTGSIKGVIRLAGKAPGNSVIRMGVDPMCSKMNAGKRVVNEIVAASADGGLANVFVRVQGKFPQTPVPTQPVTVDQRGCIYSPRVVGARAGQMLEVRNSDSLLHNVHSSSSQGNTFNIAQPKAGLVFQFRLKEEEGMVRIGCDLHRWMTAYVGVTTNPYFAVSGAGGTFQIDNVPPGTHTIQAWHERYGALTKTVRVTAGTTVAVDFTYTGTENP